ncbi:hypothetical protein ABZ318_35245, partial [Streptomyces sp. NPDC006197]
MTKPFSKLAVDTAAASAALTLAVSPASAVASTVWTVSPSPADATMVSTGHTAFVMNGFIMTCSKSTASAALRNATGNPAAIGSLGSVSFGAPGTPCTSLLGRPTIAPAAPRGCLADQAGLAAPGTAPRRVVVSRQRSFPKFSASLEQGRPHCL